MNDLIDAVFRHFRKDTNRVFILTDSCMWEKQKQDGTRAPHTIQVIDEQTGQTRYILTGARIKFLDGNISEPFTQEQYNVQMEDHKEKI